MAIARVMRRSVTLISLAGFLLALLGMTWLLNWSEATHKVDRLLHDGWVRLSQREVPSDVVIAAIDPASLQELGRWPWPRDLQSTLFQQLAEYGVKAVVIDLLYTEPSRYPGEDERLGNAIDLIPTVVMPVLTEGRVGRADLEKLPVPIVSHGVGEFGHIVLPIDDDGIVRRLNLKSGFNTAHWSTLALAAYKALHDDPESVEESLPGVRLPQASRPREWTEDYEVLIPFYGPRGVFNAVPVASIINGKAKQSELHDKIVFVGITATGLSDVVPTPVSALDQPVSGVEIHANVFAGLRDGILVSRLDTRFNLLVALLVLPLMLVVYSRSKPQWAVVAALFGALLPIGLSFLLYRWFQLWYPPLPASVPVLASYALWSWHRLEFINRFLDGEIRKLAPHMAQRDNRSNVMLAEFFTNAAKHLPIEGWRFSAQGQQFLGGDPLPVAMELPIAEDWTQHSNVYSKRYPTPAKLEIKLAIPDASMASEITAYIDSLARIRSRSKPSRFSGSLERLQGNAFKLSEQMAWLMSVKVFSETMLAGSPAGFIVWNAAGEMVRSNQLVFDLLPDLPGKPLLNDFVHAIGRHPDSGLDHERLLSMVLHGEPWQVTHATGEHEHVVNFSAVGNNLSDRLICASIIDVSQIRTVERARSEMVEYLSHDLRSPLISALYLLETHNESEGRTNTEEVDEQIRQNINRSLRMMDDLLHVARADSLTSDSFAEVLFNAVVDNALDQLLPQARQRDIVLTIDTEDEDLWMMGDPSSLERAVANILGNAIKYSEQGGRVLVKTERQGDDAILNITDEGVGIDPAIMGDLFTRFKRDARVASRFQGIGLGLALVSRVVKQHGGDVSADSSGKGTCITMRLPLATGADASEKEGDTENVDSSSDSIARLALN